jgi:hypothetical protein
LFKNGIYTQKLGREGRSTLSTLPSRDKDFLYSSIDAILRGCCYKKYVG